MKRLFLTTVFLILTLALFSRTIQEEPLFLEFLEMNYGTYTEESEYALVLESEYQKAAVAYGENYVEYAMEKDEHEMRLLLTEQGSVYSFDGRVLDISKADKDNVLFAQYLEELQILLQGHQELFHEETSTVYRGTGTLEEVPLTWVVCCDTDASEAKVTYSYTFLQGSTFTYSGTVPTAELKQAKSLLQVAKLKSFQLD